jgi:hypothetical protein
LRPHETKNFASVGKRTRREERRRERTKRGESSKELQVLRNQIIARVEFHDRSFGIAVSFWASGRPMVWFHSASGRQSNGPLATCCACAARAKRWPNNLAEFSGRCPVSISTNITQCKRQNPNEKSLWHNTTQQIQITFQLQFRKHLHWLTSCEGR